MPSPPSSSEPSSGKTVPLVVYSSDGTRTRIGNATVTDQGDRFHVVTEVTSKMGAEVFDFDVDQHCSVAFHIPDRRVVETVVVPPLVYKKQIDKTQVSSAEPLCDSEHVCAGTDVDYVVCIDGIVYGYCDDENCSGGCDSQGTCECVCHDEE